MATSHSYLQRRGQIETYFDRTAVEAWKRLTSDAPVGRIRATVRAGRDRMRQTLLAWLPADLRGQRVLDAGCGTGAFAVEAARRGAHVTAIDLSPTLVQLARERMPADLTGRAGAGRIEFLAGDMLDKSLGNFDHVVAMDSLIHYNAEDAVRVLTGLARRTGTSIIFTFAPKTPALSVMHALGRLFPRGDRAPSIEPVAEPMLRALIVSELGAGNPETEIEHGPFAWEPNRTQRIASGFYTSQAMELIKR
jgi:magnesium-protoporphyrin O-methyltransferase